MELLAQSMPRGISGFQPKTARKGTLEMLKEKIVLALLPFCSFLIGCSNESMDETFGQTELAAGNGAPNGQHYSLNIIGVPKGKTASMTGNNGSRIFVPLDGTTRIYLAEGSSFAVLDANGTDSNGAKFQLPPADADNDGTTSYSVFARALGTPGGGSSTTTCMTDSATGEEICSVYSMELNRTNGKQTFQNVSKELLYVYAQLDTDPQLERVPLFGDGYENFLWEYDNNGLKLAQLRFYPIETTVP